MKIKDMIDIIGIDDVPFIQQPAGMGKKDQLSIYANNNGINFWKDETIWGVSINNNCINQINQIKQYLKSFDNYLDNNMIEFNKYIAIYELVYSINQFKGIKENILIEQVRKYVDILDNYILNNLDFEQISSMSDLQNRIKKDKLYGQLHFYVDEVKSTKDNQYKGYAKERNKYRFGNIKYYEELDKVSISIYDDCVELTYEAEGRSYSGKVDMRRNSTLEQKILLALDCWKNYYL